MFRAAILDCVEYEGAGKGPGQAITIRNCLKVKWQIISKYEAGPKKVIHQVAFGGPLITPARVSVDGSWNCEDLHRRIYKSLLRRENQQGGGSSGR